MIKVLDLFAGTQSVRKALNDMGIEYEYKGIDVYSPEGKNIILDLTSEFALEMLLDRLDGGKPDFIWASPVCNKLSGTTTGKGGNYYFEIDKETKTIKPRENGDIKVQPHMVKYQNKEGGDKARQDAIIAVKMFENSKKIINYYDVPFAIENPATALSQYILKEYVKNDTAYCMYGFTYQKRTSIYSNKLLDLKKCNHKGKHETNMTMNTSGKDYAKRAMVPPLLIKEIITQLLEGEQDV